MDSSDAGRLRLFNFGGAHAAGVLAMTALADFYNKHAAGRRNAEPPGPSQTGLVYAFQNGDSALVQRRYRRSFGGFVIRHSSFVIRLDSRPKTSLRGLRHPRIGRNAETFSPFQNGSAH